MLNVVLFTLLASVISLTAGTILFCLLTWGCLGLLMFPLATLLYARTWKLAKSGDKRPIPPGPSGHSTIPAEGDKVRAFLAHGDYGPTGQKDRGWAVVYPNGIDKLATEKR